MKTTQPSQPHRSLHSAIRIFLSITICLVIAGVKPATAAPPSIHYYVDNHTDASINTGCQDGVDDNDCGLRGAINLANAGDTSYYHHIHLPAGTFTLTLPGSGENANVIGDLDVYGATTIIEGAGIYDTVITQSGAFDRIIDHQGTRSLKLANLTIQGGSLPSGQGGGGGLRSLDAYTLTLEYVYFFSNYVAGSNSTDRGGAVYIEDTNLSALHYTIYEENSACDGGGMAIYNSTDSVSNTFDDPLFDSNTARCGTGGGLDISGTVSLTMVSPSFAYNHARSGAGYFDSIGTDAIINDVMCYGNIIDTGGTGAACMDIFGSATVEDSMFFSNDAQTGPGAIYLKSNSVFTLTDSKLYNNSGGDAGGILAVNNTSAVLQRVQITGNTSTNGGGISVGEDGNIDLENITIAHNEAYYGGGLYLIDNASANLNHVTIASNLGDTHGDAVYIGYNGHWNSNNSIFYWSPGGDVCYYGDPSYSVGSNIHNIENSNTCKLAGLTNTNPMLGVLDAYDSDMLTMPPLPGSPAIDGAIADDPVSMDQRGVPRLDGDRDGMVISDIGAHETNTFFFLPLILAP